MWLRIVRFPDLNIFKLPTSVGRNGFSHIVLHLTKVHPHLYQHAAAKAKANENGLHLSWRYGPKTWVSINVEPPVRWMVDFMEKSQKWMRTGDTDDTLI